MRQALRVGATLLGLAAFLDIAREAFTGGAWGATPALGQVYSMTVGAYAASREWEKWSDPDDQRSYGGHWFVVAWLALPALVWLAGVTMLDQVSWPAALDQTLGWVLAAYAGGKASASWRAAKLGRGPAPEDWSHDALRHGALLLGLVCYADAALEGFTLGEWSFAPGLYKAYAIVLAAYAGTRQWEKWTGAQDTDVRYGAAFVLAWPLLAVLLWLYRATGHLAMWPRSLNFAIGTVLAVFTGTKASAYALAQSGGWGGQPAPNPAPAPGPRPGPEPQPTPGPAPDPDRPPPSPGSPKRPVDPSKVDPRAAAACKARGLFQAPDIAADLGCSEPAAYGYIGVMVRAGLVQNEGHGWYKWVGD